MRTGRHAARIAAAGIIATSVFIGGCAMRPVAFGVEYAEVEPPPPQEEVIVTSPGPGYYWIEGHWYVVGGAYQWAPGRWERVPEGRHEWRRGRWHHDHHGWYWEEGHWR